MQERFLEYIEEGLLLMDACALTGLAVSTFHHWIERGEIAEQPYADFMDAVRAAEAHPRAAAMRVVMTGILGDPRRRKPADPSLALKYLQQRWPRQFQALPEPALAPEPHDQNRAGMIVRFADPARRALVRELLDGLTGAQFRTSVDETNEQPR
ncbi:MAG TPA: hypothetical protein DEV93_15990 [Chloroflexi bacterium]|nr:hypothetical protein [Chloroflexota bacterium]